MSTADPKLTLIVRVKGEDGCGGVFVDVALSSLTSLASEMTAILASLCLK